MKLKRARLSSRSLAAGATLLTLSAVALVTLAPQTVTFISAFGVPIDCQSEERHAKLYDDEIPSRMMGPFSPDDPALLHIIQQHHLLPPSHNPYHLQHTDENSFHSYMNSNPSWILIDSVLNDLFKEKQHGFFVEAGAFDGEMVSNTLRIEMQQNWTGLLVEPDSDNFALLKQKNRKTWLSHSCLSLRGYPEAVTLRKIRSNSDSVHWTARAASRVIKNDSEIAEDSFANLMTLYQSAQCLPAQSLLWALNVTHVDFFSLDIEMAEVTMLDHFPFEQITVDVWVIEHRRHDIDQRDDDRELVKYTLSDLEVKKYSEKSIKNRQKLISEYEDQIFIKFMVSKGYYYFDATCAFLGDYVFVLKNTDIFRKLKVPQHQENRSEICKYKKLYTMNSLTIPSTLLEIRDPHHYPQVTFREVL